MSLRNSFSGANEDNNSQYNATQRSSSRSNLSRASSYCASQHATLNTSTNPHSTSVFAPTNTSYSTSPPPPASPASATSSLASKVPGVDLFGRFSAIVKRNTVSNLSLSSDPERRQTSGFSPTFSRSTGSSGRFRFTGSERKSSFPTLPSMASFGSPLASSSSSSCSSSSSLGPTSTHRIPGLAPTERKRRRQMERLEFSDLHAQFAWTAGSTTPRLEKEENNQQVEDPDLTLQPREQKLSAPSPFDSKHQKQLHDQLLTPDQEQPEQNQNPWECGHREEPVSGLKRYLSEASSRQRQCSSSGGTDGFASRLRIYQPPQSCDSEQAEHQEEDQKGMDLEDNKSRWERVSSTSQSQNQNQSYSRRSDLRTQTETETELEMEVEPAEESNDLDHDHDSFLDAVCRLQLHEPQQEGDEVEDKEQADLLTSSVRHLVLRIKNDSEQFHQRQYPSQQQNHSTPRRVPIVTTTSATQVLQQSSRHNSVARRLFVRHRGNSCPVNAAQLDVKPPRADPGNQSTPRSPVARAGSTPPSPSPASSPFASATTTAFSTSSQPARRSAFARIVSAAPSRLFESLGFGGGGSHSSSSRQRNKPTGSYLLTDDQLESVEGARWKIVELAFRFGGKHRFYLVQAVNMFFPLVKYGRHGGPHATRLHCNRCGTIQWQHKRGGLSEPMDLAQVVDIYEGRQSIVFLKQGNSGSGNSGIGTLSSHCFDDSGDSRCFSLVFAKRTLDLETSSADHRDWLLSALRTLISYAKKQREVEKRALMEEEARQLAENAKKTSSSAAITA